LYTSPNIIWVTKSRRIRWPGHVAHMGKSKCVCMVLVGKPEGRRPFGRLRRRCEDNIKMNLQEVERRAWKGFVF
jgi:hypothetical protein